jgi:hypothetical protein
LPESSPVADMKLPIQSLSTAKLSALKRAILQFLEPGVLPVLAMALIVGGWSYGLKLSHYLNTGVTKASTTRMWLDHRNEATAAPATHEQDEHKFPTTQLCVVEMPSLPLHARPQLIAESASVHTLEFVSPLHPLRAPPSISLLA